MSVHDDLPDGISVLHREPPQRSIELALELAHLGGSLKLVRAAGGEEAVEALHGNGDGDGTEGNGSTDPAAAIGTHD